MSQSDMTHPDKLQVHVSLSSIHTCNTIINDNVKSLSTIKNYFL
jgi:hypothetical protein